MVVLVAAIVLGVALLKPWAAQPSPDSKAVIVSPAPGLGSPAPVASSESALIPIRPDALTVPVWPAQSVPSRLTDATASQAESVLGRLTIHSGQWGVGNAGVGPRMLRDEPWTDWVAAVPEAVVSGPLNVMIWPGGTLCGGLPAIYDNPSLVAITAPSALVPDWRLAGWWTDGNHVTTLEGSVRQVSPAGNRGISYLERTDRAAWPPGRYEFHVTAGESTVSLTVCITRRG
jgi:hypothetical protein